MADVRPQQTNSIAKSNKVSTAFVRAIIGLSRGVRTNIRLQLHSIKRGLQGKVSQIGFKTRLIKRKQVENEKLFGKMSADVSRIKSSLNTVKVGPNFQDNEALKLLSSMLLVNVSVKGAPIGGYKDLDNGLSSLSFNARQLTKAINFTELAANLINKKIDEVDTIIQVLDDVDSL